MEYKLVHIGVNCGCEEKAAQAADLFALLFDLKTRVGNSSIFAGPYFECMRVPDARGTNGHIAMAAEDLSKAIEELKAKGFDIVPETLTTDENGKPKNVYLKGEFAGFAVHILQAK